MSEIKDDADEDYYTFCCFCGLLESKVKFMVKESANICDKCVLLAAEAIRDREAAGSEEH